MSVIEPNPVASTALKSIGTMESKAISRLRITLWISGILFLWTGSAFFLIMILRNKPHPGAIPPSISDLATIFFGASSLALIIFSLLIAVAAIIEWQSLKKDIRKEIEASEAAQTNFKRLEDATEKKIRELEKELRGRVDAVMGAMIGTVHSKPTELEQSDDDKDYIAEAIDFCKNGYRRLETLEGNGKYMALNNLVYFSTLLKPESKRDALLAQGRELRDVGKTYEDSRHIAPYFLTYCRVISVYGSDIPEIKEALAIAKDLQKTGLTSLLMKEATFIVASLTAKLEKRR